MESEQTHGSSLDREALGAQVRTGLKWVSLAVLGLELSAMGSTVVLARLVSPAQYGRAVIALIVPVIASILTYEGFGTPLVQRAEISRRHIEASSFVSLVSGVVFTGLTVLFAVTIARPLFGREMTGLFELASPAFLIVSAGCVPRALLARSMSWRLMNLADVGGAVVTGIVSIVLAACGLSAAAIIIGSLVGGVVSTLVYQLRCRPARPRFHLRETREVVGFGGHVAIAGTAMTIRRNIDYIVLATRVSPHLVGIYWRGFSTGVDYQSKISNVTSRVSTTILPRAGRADDLREMRGHLVRLNTIIVFPFLGILVATAPWAIPAIYGAQWSEAVVPTQVLAVGGMAWAVLAGVDGVTLASGHPAVLAVFNVVSLVLVGLVAYLIAPFGIVAVASAMVGLELAFLLIAQYWVLYRIVGIPLRDTFRDPAPAIVCTGIMIMVLAPIASLLGPHLPALLTTGVCGVLGLVVYGLAVRRLSPSGWRILSAILSAVAPVRRARAVGRRLVPRPPVPVTGHDG
jgi:O-antigen/teichoic acid export membrane protein